MKISISDKLFSAFSKNISLIMLFIVLGITNINAATITSTATGGAWATGGSWVGGVAPGTGDAVIIATTGAGAVTIGAAVTQTAAGSVTVNNGATLTSNTGGISVTFGSLTINSGGTFTSYRPLTILGATSISGTINFGSSSGTSRLMTFTGAVTLNNGAFWNETTNGAAATFSFGNYFTNNATTFTAQNTAHDFTGSGGILSGGTPIAFPTATFTGNYTNNGTLTVSTLLTVTGAGITITNNGIITSTTALSGTGGVTNAATGTLNIGGTSGITTLTATAVGDTVKYTGGTQTVKPTTYNNLILSGSGTKTTNSTIVTGMLSIEGTATPSATAPVFSGTAYKLQYKTTDTHTAGAEWINPFVGSGGVIIANTAGSVTMNSAEVLSTSIPLSISSGATLNTSASNYSLTLGGDFSNAGTFTANASPIVITGTATQSIAGFSTTGAVSSTKTGGTATLAGNVTAGSLTINGSGGTLNIGTSLSHSITGDVIITAGTLNAGSSTLTTSGNWTNNAWSSFTPGTSTVTMTGTTKTIGGSAPTTFNNLTISSGSTTLNINGSIGGNLTISSGATLTNSSTYTLSVTGTTTISGTYTDGSTGAKSFTGDISINSGGVWNETNSAAYNIAGSLTNNGTSFTSNSGTHTFTGGSNLFSGSTITSIPNLTLSGSYTNNGTVTVGTTFGGSGSIVNNGTLNIGGTSWSINLTASAIGNTVNYTGSSAQTIKGNSYYNLGLSGGGTKTFPSSITISNNISFASGTAANLGSNFLHTANVLNLNGIPQSSSTYGGTGSLATNINTSYFVANTGILSTANNWTGATNTDWGTTTNWSKGTVPTASDVAFIPNVTNNPIINSSAVCLSLTVNASSSVTINGSNTLTVSGNIINAGTITSNSGTILLTGTFTNTGTFNSNTGTVNYNGAAQTVAGINYYHLTLSGSGAKTLQSGTTTIGGNLTLSGTVSTTTVAGLSINGNLSIGNGTTLNAAAFNLTITGTTTVGGGTSGILNITGINTKTFTGDVILSSGSTWNESAASDVSFGGSFSNNAATFTLSTGNHTFSGSSNLFSGSTITSIPYLTLSGSYTNSGTLTVGTTFGGSGNIINNGTLNIGGTAWSINLTATAIGNTVNYTGSSAQTIRAITYYNLGFSGGGTKTFPSSITINNNISFASGTAADLGSNLLHTANVLILNGITQTSSTYGGTGSSAININTTYFVANTGILSTSNNWTGATNTDWGTATNWLRGTVPTASDAVIIPNVTNKPIIGAAATCNNITINASSSVTITGTNTLTVTGNWTNNGTFTANSSTVLLTGGAQTISGATTFNNLTAGGTGLKTFSTTPTVNGILSMEGTGTVSAAPTYVGAATLQYNTTTARTAGVEWISPVVATGGVIIGSTGAITLNSAEQINAPLTINSGATLNTSAANNYSLTLGGNYINNGGTLTANASPIVITGTGTQSIAGFTTTGAVSSTKTGGVATLGGNVGGASLTINGAGGTLNVGSGLSHTFTGNIVLTTGTLDGGTSTINTAGNWTNNGGTFTPTTGTVNFTGSSMAINGTAVTQSFNNLTVNKTAAQTLSVGGSTTTLNVGGNFTETTGNFTAPATMSITGNTTLTAGTFTAGTNITAGANWTNNGGTFTPGTGTVTMTGTGSTIGGSAASNTFYKLTINSGGTTLGKNATVYNTLTMTNGILTTSTSALLSITNTATTAIAGGSATSFVNGPLNWRLPASLVSGSTYVFPIGKNSTYLPFSLVNPTTGTGIVTAQPEAFDSNSSGAIDATLSAISSTEYWSLAVSGIFTNSSISVSKTTAISPYNVLGGNATAANGTYTNLNGTFGTYGITNSNLIGSNRFFVLGQGAPTITLSNSSLSGFSYPFGMGPSTEQSFTVSGINLVNNISITPATDYEISTTSGGLFVATNPITLTVSGGSVATTTIYVRLKSGLAIGTYSNSEIITASSSGATNNTVTCSGTVGSAPSITVSPTSLSGFTYVYTKGPTTQQTFTVSGTSLAGNVIVTPPSDYQISTTSGSGYVSTPITLTPTSGTLSSTTIYVIMPSGLGVGSHNQNITATSAGATDKTVALAGTVTPAPTLTTATSYLAGFIYTAGAGPSGEQSFALNGTNLSTTLRNDTIVAPANFEISTTSGSGFTTGSIILTRAAGVSTLSTTIYTRMVTALAAGNYGPVNVSLKSSGAIVKTVALVGTVVTSSPVTPTVQTSVPTLTGFGYMQGTGPSSEQKFTVSGTSLSTGIVLTPPSNYEISTTSGSGFQSTPITISLTSGRVNPTYIYVRLKSALTAGNYNGVNITAVSTGATTKNVALLGTVFISPLVTAGGGGTFCVGSTINLTSVGADIQNRYWQGPNSFYTLAQNPTLTPATTAMSGTYTVTGNVNVGGNLVFNGDFELGKVGFGSGYNYVDTTNTQALYPEGTYTVVKLPHSVHPNFSTWPDHTGRGLQMVVNGAPIAGVVVWSQSVPVIPGATYAFTYWEQTVNVPENPKNASQLQLYVNGVAAGPVYTAPLVNNSWAQFLYNAAAGSNTVLNLELINQNTVASGNDFALDDIVFGQILPATSTTDVTVNPVVPVSVSVAASANPVFRNTPVTYTATPTNGGSTPAYQWQVNGVNVGTNSVTYTYIPVDGDVIKCILTSSLTCVSNNPANASVIATVITRTNYWYGYIDTDWAKARNWTGNYVPLPGDDVEYATVANTDSVAINDLWLDKNRTIGSLINATTKALIIPAAKGLKVNNYAITDGNPNRIDILSSSTLSNGSLNFVRPTQNTAVNATVEMYSRASWDLAQPVNSKYKWQYFGIPVTTVKAMPTFMGSYVRKWYETGTNITNHWIQLAGDSILQPFYGYEICQAAPTTIVFQGTLVTSNFSTGQMAITPTALYPGQHVYANSYTAGISIKDIDYGSDTESTAYLYNTGTYNQWLPDGGHTSGQGTGQYIAVPKNLAGTTGLPAQVASMQSILIKALLPTSNATFGIRYTSTIVDNDSAIHRIKGTFNNTFENTDKVTTIIDVTGSKSSDRLWLVTQPGCSNTFNNGWDGSKFIGSALSPQIYAIEPDGIYQVNTVADINDTEIGFQVGEDTEYTMTFTHTNIKSNYAGIYIVDLLENRTIDVTESGSTYTFTASSSTQVEKRFKIVARHYEENAPDTESQVKVFSSNGNIFVQNLDNTNGDIMIFDIAGHYLEKVPLVPNGIITLSGIVPGAYVAKVITAKEDFSKRLIVR